MRGKYRYEKITYRYTGISRTGVPLRNLPVRDIEQVLLLAVVLPFKPFVEDGSRKLAPTERFPGIPSSGKWEHAIAGLV